MRTTTECSYLAGAGPEGMGPLQHVALFHSHDTSRGRGVYALAMPMEHRSALPPLHALGLLPHPWPRASLHRSHAWLALTPSCPARPARTCCVLLWTDLPAFKSRGGRQTRCLVCGHCTHHGSNGLQCMACASLAKLSAVEREAVTVQCTVPGMEQGS